MKVLKMKVYIEVKETIVKGTRKPIELIWEGRTYKVDEAQLLSLTESSDGTKAIPCICLINGKYSTIWLDGARWFVEI